MDAEQIHFEVFARHNEAANLMLEMATEDRAKALEFAENLLEDQDAVAVRVTKETRDAETGEYRSVTILTKGSTEKRRAKPAPEDVGPPCITPQDLYSTHARQRIGRILQAWLDRNKATPFELLHRPDLAERLEASGVEMQHAVQKVAIPEAQAKGVSVHEVIRSFNSLVERATLRLIKDCRRGYMADLDRESFEAACARLIDDPESAYRLGGGVAARLAQAKTWSGKIERLLDLADCAPGDKRQRALAFEVLEQPLGEILGSRPGMAELLGSDLDLGGSLTALTRLAFGVAVDRADGIDASVRRMMPPLDGAAKRLSRWMEGAYFQPVRIAIGRCILSEIKSSRRLRPGDAQSEIDVLRVLATVLTVASGKLLSADDIREAFIERSRLMMGVDFVNAAVAHAKTALDEVRALARLAENVTGPANRRQAALWLIGAITALRFEKELRESREAPSVRLQALAELQRVITRIDLPDADRQQIHSRIGDVGGMVEADANLVESVARASAPAMQRISVLLKLALGETAPTGPAAARAKAALVRLAKTPEVRAELIHAPELIERLRPLMQAA